jgi:hypothetical protein
MADITSGNLAQIAGGNLEQASPDSRLTPGASRLRPIS